MGESEEGRAPSAYDAPEVATAGPSPASDVWSLGATLVAVLTQNEPKLTAGKTESVAVPVTIPQPLREIARQCLQADSKKRCTADDILRQVRTQTLQTQAAPNAKAVEVPTPRERPKQWIVAPIIIGAGILLMALIGIKFMAHQPAVPATETRPAAPPAEAPPGQSSAPFSENKKPAQGIVRGSVRQQVLPDVSQSAQNTITGRLKVSVQVEVDTSGNVSQAKLVSPGPSTYFANHALAAARRWKFNPSQVEGQAAASEWVLRFQFARTSVQVFPTEIKP
jgi:TonB family protein